MESGHDVSIDWTCHLSGDKWHYTCPNLILSPVSLLLFLALCSPALLLLLLLGFFYRVLLTLFNTNFLKLLYSLWRI
jgi:hypothetical protein